MDSTGRKLECVLAGNKRRCDGKVPTLTIVKVFKNAKKIIFGGFATKTWAGNDGEARAPGSFLYSLRNNDDLTAFKAPLINENDEWAISRYSVDGPTFGGGELFIPNNAVSNPNTQADFGTRYQPPHGYTANQPNTKSLLAGSSDFLPSEVEVLYLN
ncbi:Hypothetical predicted protein [Paramuricea clavata]|uniref:TLDc domain-containing protein n=1 Tax=Paramuricea clavata TaxID=317549 RepID=A0A7D9HZD1_PARCT|nr:Hypothetical predicted protein [Paramuricea clavata]